MDPYEAIKSELYEYYFERLPQKVEKLRQTVFGIMDRYAAGHPAASSYFLKAKLYDVIAENIEPGMLPDIPFAFETGALLATCDGRFNRGGEHANGWLIHRNRHLYEDHDPETYAEYNRIHEYFAQTGVFADFMHLGIPMKKVFRIGLRGILRELRAAEETCETPAEREFIACAEAGICAMQKIALKLSEAAAAAGMDGLADMVARVPYDPPETFHEGLNTLGFMRKVLGTLEGYGFSSMGRPDVLLAPLYERDRACGVRDDEMLDLVSRFLLFWDCTNDRRKKFENGWEYELENTVTLGGCDDGGAPVFNGVTRLFITARDSLRCTYPKMMLRFSESSPEEYLRLVSRSLTRGQSYSLYENDDVTIPALVGCGTELRDARGYVVGGCWDPLTPDTNNKFSGEYFFLTTPFKYLMRPDGGHLREIGVDFIPFEKAGSFEELYGSYLGVVDQILKRKLRLENRGSRIWDRVNPACALSALMEPCIPMKKDMTAGGIKYSRESAYFTCFAEVVDSLYAIKRLCFDDRVLTVKELMRQCAENWPDEELRRRAVSLPSYGDGSEESSRFAGRFYDDLVAIAGACTTAYGGKCRPGFNLYTEIVYLGEETEALPNGRRAGEYLSQGITPSRLQKECSLYDLLDSVRYIDFRKTSGNSSITLTLPAGKLDEEKMAVLFRVFARNGLQAVQPNCVSREELIAAQADPENHRDIIVRVCGFSAPFVCLSPKYQDEIISRNMSEI